MQMKTISIKVDDDIFNEIEEQRGKKPKNEFYRELLENYLKKPKSLNEDDSIVLKENESLKAELVYREKVDKIMEERIKSLENQLGFLQHEYGKVTRVFDQLLLPEPAEAKKWWKFWK